MEEDETASGVVVNDDNEDDDVLRLSSTGRNFEDDFVDDR